MTDMFQNLCHQFYNQDRWIIYLSENKILIEKTICLILICLSGNNYFGVLIQMLIHILKVNKLLSWSL